VERNTIFRAGCEFCRRTNAALEKLPGNELMGWCGLQHLPETGETEIGYLLGKRFWGNGIASASADVSLRYGFTTVGLEKIIALVHPENHSSIEVIKKLAMKLCDRIHLWGMDLDRYCITSRKYFEIMEYPR
jgi:RimJ/RimL family protein N-acetyltransferase